MDRMKYMQVREDLQQAESRFKAVFDESPLSLWIVDVSELLVLLERLRSEGVTDFASYFDHHPQVVRICSKHLKVINVNRSTLKMYGAASQRELLANLSQVYTPEALHAFRAGLVALAEGQSAFELETLTRKLSGEAVSNTITGNLVTTTDGPFLLVTLADISTSRQAERALAKSERRYRDLFENASDIIQILSAEGRLLYVNPTWLQIFGYSLEESATMRVFDFIHPDCADSCYNNFNLVLSQGRLRDIQIAFRAKDGRKVTVEGNVNCQMEDGKPQYVQCIFRDVTDRKIMEEELRKAQKFESIGLLAGGIAHDFNNILTSVTGNISLALLHARPGDKIYEKLTEAERVILRAKDLTQQLLTFSKGGKAVKRLIDVQELLKEASGFVLRGSKVRCTYRFPGDLWAVEADEGQISQVVHNLVINADQAMPTGGEITIAAQNRAVAAEDNLGLNPGRYVVVSVVDQGTGIKSEHLARIFDPYFSTKPNGHGLGLATSYSIVKNHGGLMAVDSTVGHGTTFTIFLPASLQQAAPNKEEQRGLLRGRGRILVVDDEEIIRQVVAEMLSHLGYEVSTVADGREALVAYEGARETGRPFCGVIMDLTIPGGMGGRETISKLLASDPNARVIVSSGYANDPMIEKYEEYGFVGGISKPFRMESLSAALQEFSGCNAVWMP